MDNDKRKYERLSIECTALLANPKELRVAEFKDISLNGLLVKYHLPTDVQVGDSIRCFFYYRKATILCSLETTVVRTFVKDGHTYAGLTFKENDVGVQKVLDQLHI